MRSTILVISAVMLAGWVPALADEPADRPPATQPDALASLKAQQRQAVEHQHGNQPVVGPFAARDVIQIELDNGRLTVDTALPATGSEQRVEVTDDPGLWWAVVNNRPDGAPMYMVVQRYDFSSPDNVFTHAMLTAGTTQVNLSGVIEDMSGTVQIELLDRSPLVSPEEGVVEQGGLRLFLNGYDAQGMRTTTLRVEAPDLHALREAHPEVVNTHLRRVLEDLGQGHVLAVDEKLAWQVLGSERPVDPDILRRVQEILPQLDADAFAERERAADALRALGDEGAAALARMDRSDFTAEQNARVDELLRDFRPVSDRKASALADDPEFLLDALLVDDVELRRLAMQRLREIVDPAISFDVEAPALQRAERVAALRRALRSDSPTTQPAQ